tara:strand:- start:1643 stop:2446 length:804 start_codon:yes stop_codon:yes gene_type:complete
MSISFNKQPYMSWKDLSNKVIIKANTKNSNDGYTSSCSKKKCNTNFKSGFNSRPINHYRKEYISKNNSISNYSLIGLNDAPGNFIISNDLDLNKKNIYINITNNNQNCNGNSYDKFYDISNSKLHCTSFNPKNMTIKRATTVLDNNYCTTNKELLEKKCKTIVKNMPISSLTYQDINNNNGTMQNCNEDNCKITFKPSNKKFQCQGPVSSSARTASLRYCNINNQTAANYRKCYLKNNNTDYNSKINLSSLQSCNKCKNYYKSAIKN